ncbi:hypothetical protein D3C87_363860 [compost metagenome]
MSTVEDIPLVGIVDLEREPRIWFMRQIFTGKPGTGLYCPNVDDLIIDLTSGWYLVTTIDITTGKCTFIPWKLPMVTENNVVVDQLLGVGTGSQSETWRVYVDTRQMPYSMQIDGRLHLYRSDADHYKVFLGTDLTDNGILISASYSPSGEYENENIGLEHVGHDDINNWAIWAPKAGNTNRKLNNGEVVTVVLYNAVGNALSHSTMLVENTTLVRRTAAGRKQIRSVGLRSPYLSESDPSQLVVPINVDLRTVVMTGVVRYNTGEEMEIPVVLDGTGKMSLHGLRWYSPTIQTYAHKLTLSYKLSDDEFSLEHGITENGFITEPFTIKAVAADNAYSVRLYAFPTWNDPASRYDLDFWLFNIDRDQYYRVPRSVVETPDNEVAFDGRDYVSRQRLKFGVLLSNVDPIFPEHKFVQSAEFSLMKPGSEKGDKWQVKCDPSQEKFFGAGVVAKNRFVNVNLSYLDLKAGATDLDGWFNKVYYPLNHLFDDTSEVEALEPTHFVIHTKTREYPFAVTQWNQEFPILNDVKVGEAIYIRWIRETSNAQLQLGVTGLAVEQSN